MVCYSAKRTLSLLYITLSIFLTSCTPLQDDEYQGYIDGDLTYIASPFSGDLENLSYKEGDWVKSGDLLIQLELEPQQSQFQQANYELQSAQKTLDNITKGERETVVSGIEAEIAKAKSELALAEVRMQRAKTLYDKNLTEKDKLDEATTEFNTKSDTLRQLQAKLQEAKLGERIDVIAAQEARVKSAQAKVDELTWALNAKQLKAPDEGYIQDIFYHQGEFVPASKSILSLLTPYHQYVIFFVPLEKINGFTLQSKVDITCAGCAQSYQANISYIAPNVEYTPPVIFSREHHDKYVYRLHAALSKDDVKHFRLGQPVYVKLISNT